MKPPILRGNAAFSAGDFPLATGLNGGGLDADQGGRNARWHTDVTFVAEPPAASILVGDAVPEFGGDTLWADLRTAYEQLAAPLRDLVDELQAVHRISPLAYWGEPFDSALSRDDAGNFLGAYEQRGLIAQDPFISLDAEGVGELMMIGAERGRSTRPDIKLGICGEHGGDPASIAFCQTVPLDYVSCSPYRVPIARLAAAQAALARKNA